MNNKMNEIDKNTHLGVAKEAIVASVENRDTGSWTVIFYWKIWKMKKTDKGQASSIEFNLEQRLLLWLDELVT